MPTRELEQLFKAARSDVFRLETRDNYVAPGEQEELRAFLEGRPFPLADPATVPWLANVQKRTKAGVRWRRVHVVQQPLTEYLKFEFYGYQENINAGEEIRIADRSSDEALQGLYEDFWLFDHDVVILMKYDNSGRLIDTERINGTSRYTDIMNHALSHSLLLEDYVNSCPID